MNKRGVFSFLNLIRGINNPYSEISSLKVRDLMTKEVVTVAKTKPLTDAAYMMIGEHISCLVVTDEQKPSGIITERDFIKKIDMSRTAKKDFLVGDIMTGKIVTIDQDTNLFTARKIMEEHKFRKLVVADKSGIAGIITQSDLCRAVSHIRTLTDDVPKVSTIMTKIVISASPDDSFQKVKKIMAQKDLGSIVIQENGKILGIFTEADIVSEYYLNPNRLRNSYMENLMTIPVVCITPDFDIFLANKMMIEKNFRRLPIVDNGVLVGIITQTDVANAIYTHLLTNKDKKYPQKWRLSDPEVVVEKRENIMLLGIKK